MNKPAVIRITEALPEDAITAPLGVGPRSIRLARERGVFPASWYPVLRDACHEAGIDCPESAFNWKIPESGESLSATKDATACRTVQVTDAKHNSDESDASEHACAAARAPAGGDQ